MDLEFTFQVVYGTLTDLALLLGGREAVQRVAYHDYVALVGRLRSAESTVSELREQLADSEKASSSSASRADGSSKRLRSAYEAAVK